MIIINIERKLHNLPYDYESIINYFYVLHFFYNFSIISNSLNGSYKIKFEFQCH